MPPKRTSFKRSSPRATSGASAKVASAQPASSAKPDYVQETPESTAPSASVHIAENMMFSDTTQRPEWDLFLELIDGSCTILAEIPAKMAMNLLAKTFNSPLDVVKQELQIQQIVVIRAGTKITAHHVEQPSLTFTMHDTSQPILWLKMLQETFSKKMTLTTPTLPQVSKQIQTLLRLCTRLPPLKKMVVNKQGDEMVLNIIGDGFNAIVRIVGEQVLENRRFPQFCVPWSTSPRANTALGTQILMIPDNATKIMVEIVPTPSNGYIGFHDYGVEGFVCLSLQNAMKKYRLSKPIHITLSYINPSLMVLKTPNSSYDGVIEQIQKKDREFVWFEGGRRFSWSEIQNLDTVFYEFSQSGKL
jgi:hypothetical protein